jgi:predicted dehydrogenase
MTELTIGLIGLDTSHVSVFARLLNDPSDPHHKPGARVTYAWPGGSPDFPLSANRVEGFTAELRDQRGVEILDSPEAVAAASDLIFITAVDGRTHPDLLRRIIPAGKPVFIDKPFALTSAAAKEMIDLAGKAGVPLMSCSSLRYAEHLQTALAGGRGNILGCDVFGPMPEQETQPGLFWYGIHSVEMMVAIMGTGCAEVRCVRNEGNDLLVATWHDGRVATLRGSRAAHEQFGAVIHRKDGATMVDASSGRPYYLALLDAILSSLPAGKSAIDAEETLEVIRMIEAANSSRARNGEPRPLP